MSLKRRIAGAAALAVAAVAVAVVVVGYASARSHLIGEIKQELWARARPYLQPHDHGFHNQRPGRPPFGAPGGEGPAPRQPFGGAPGYFQVVQPDGTVFVPFGETAKLPVGGQALRIAKQARGSYFSSARVSGAHLEILTVGDPVDHHAIQVALPLAGVDSVLSGLLLPYGLLIAGGILLAGLLGLAISRSALRPIERFVARTERVTSSLEQPARLEEADAVELRRLAASFNQTLGALERSIDAQRQLVADASHELRTPIAALRSNIQIFLEADRLPAHERDGLQGAILAELDELTQIVSDVVELARGAGPRPSSRLESLELDVLVREAVERSQRRAPQLRFDTDVEPTVLIGDPDRISRAITNVVDNARKWSPPDAVVEVTLRNGTLSVRDHGPGFSERDLPHVFDRFYRAESARRMPGSGLGLAIVKQAAEAHGGSAQATNAADGGAVLTVSFGPMSAQEPARDLLAH